jgi:fatty acid desaturase
MESPSSIEPDTQAPPGLREAPDRGLAASAVIDRAEVRAFYTPAPARVWRDASATWLTILLALAAAAQFPHPLVLAVAFIAIAARQLALSHLVHDAAHFNISRDKARNDWLSDVFFAAPTLIATATYRAQHQSHHAHLGEAERDGDVRTWYSLRGGKVVSRVALTLLGGEALKTIASYSEHGRRQAPADSLRQLALVALTNSVLVGYCVWLGSPLVYFGLWLLPIFTLTVLLLTLRVIAEHQNLDYARAGADDFERDMLPPLVRTIEAGPIGRFLLGSMNFCYHHEHHLYPAIPYARLPELHRLLIERGYYAERPDELAAGYAQVLRSLVAPPPVAGHAKSQQQSA